MLLTNVFSILGGLLMGLSYVFNNYEMVIIGRFVIGYYAGILDKSAHLGKFNYI